MIDESHLAQTPSKVLRLGAGGKVYFLCPGCGEKHGINTGMGPGPRWMWDGDIHRPTFSPSIKVTGRRVGDEGWNPKAICHSYVSEGHIQFLTDSDHPLSGQTVDLPEWTGESS